MYIEKNYSASDGLNVKYWVMPGKSKEAPLLFVHGVGGNSTAWGGVIQRLSGLGRTIIRLDLRCHGKSEMSMSRGTYSIDKIAEDLDGILAAENISSAVFIAHSFGGVCVLKQLVKKNSRAAGAVLCNSPHSNPTAYSSSRMLKYANPVLRMLIWCVAAMSPFRRKQYPYPDYYALRDRSEAALWFHDISAAPLRVFFYNYLLLFRFDLTQEEISSIPVEFLLFTSDNDPFLSKRSVYDLSKLVKTYKLVELQGCDHETIMRKDEEIADEIGLYLKALSKKKAKKGKVRNG